MLGLISWILVFWFQESIGTVVHLVGEANAGHLRSGVGLTATTVSAMVGALFSTAITNKAQFLNKKEIEALTQQMATVEEQYRKPAEEIRAKLTDKTQFIPKDEFFRLVEQRKELLAKYYLKIRELQNEIKKLSP
jgi:L-cystine uptake protein TcyP (sodium:dicarboxylate symporter family)